MEEYRGIYATFFKEYGYALCRLIAGIIEQPFTITSFERQVFGEIISLGDAIYGISNVESDFKEANSRKLKPYIDLYNAVTQAIYMTTEENDHYHRPSQYQNIYPSLLIESYGAFRQDVAGAYYIDDSGAIHYFRDEMCRKMSEVRQTALKNTLDFIEMNEQTHAIPYAFNGPGALALIRGIIQIIKKSRDKEETVPEDRLQEPGRELTGTESRALTMNIYRSGLWRFSESGYDDAIIDLLDALEITTSYKTHWNKTKLKYDASIEYGTLIVSYEKDRYVTTAELVINGKSITKTSMKKVFSVDLDFLAHYHGIEKIEKIEVLGYRSFNDRYLLLEASKSLTAGNAGWLPSLTNPKREASLTSIQLGITLVQSLHALKQISREHWSRVDSIVAKKGKKKKKLPGQDYYSLWILTAFLMVIDFGGDLFIVHEQPKKKKIL